METASSLFFARKATGKNERMNAKQYERASVICEATSHFEQKLDGSQSKACAILENFENITGSVNPLVALPFI